MLKYNGYSVFVKHLGYEYDFQYGVITKYDETCDRSEHESICFTGSIADCYAFIKCGLENMFEEDAVQT